MIKRLKYLHYPLLLGSKRFSFSRFKASKNIKLHYDFKREIFFPTAKGVENHFYYPRK